MFVTTAVFLTGMLFVIQQAFLTYSSLDLSQPFETSEHRTVKNVIDVINETILSQPYTGDPLDNCREFEKNLKELIHMLKTELILEGYLLDARYTLDCANWENTGPPDPAPLTVGISFTGIYDANGVLYFYHSSVSEMAVCQAASDDGMCDVLDRAYWQGYRDSCCNDHGLCCAP